MLKNVNGYITHFYLLNGQKNAVFFMTTIRDVAQLAQVSTATVSRVISSPHLVQEKTKLRVQEAMRTCNYQYNGLAKSFVTKQSSIIGVIIPSITNPIFAESTRGIQAVAREHSYHIILGNTDYDRTQGEWLIHVFRQMQVDGLLLSTTDPENRVLHSLLQDEFPFALLFSTLRQGPMACIGADNLEGGHMAISHLLHFGHRRIGMVAGRFSFSDKSFHRWQGYVQAIQEYGLEPDPDLLVQTEYTLEHGMQAVHSLVSAAAVLPPTSTGPTHAGF